jgi:DNA repair protein RadC
MALTGDKSVKNWDEGERSWERFTAHESSPFSEAGILAGLFRKGTLERTVVDRGRELLKRFESPTGIELASNKEICGVEEIGPAQTVEINTAMELGRRSESASVAAASLSLCPSRDIVEYYQPQMKYEKKEMSPCTPLDTENKNLLEKSIPIGSFTADIVHPRYTFKATIPESADTADFIHNQPSGDIQSSKEDVLLTKQRIHAEEILGIQVINYSIGNEGHFSFMDRGLLQRPS